MPCLFLAALVAGVPPHELVVVQRAVGGALGVAPPANHHYMFCVVRSYLIRTKLIAMESPGRRALRAAQPAELEALLPITGANKPGTPRSQPCGNR